MNKQEYANLMNFPKEWLEWNMYPDELFTAHLKTYMPGNENASEHDRNGAFHWWLKRKPTADTLRGLILLSVLDPDQHMASDVRKYISASPEMTSELRSILNRIINLE